MTNLGETPWVPFDPGALFQCAYFVKRLHEGHVEVRRSRRCIGRIATARRDPMQIEGEASGSFLVQGEIEVEVRRSDEIVVNSAERRREVVASRHRTKPGT
jgi:hypothetical protein